MLATRSILAAGILSVLTAASGAEAQQRYQTLGPNECLNCHDHQKERQWYERQEIPEVRKLFPDKGANAGHINSLKQLETGKSNEFAKAVGLSDKYDTNGMCVRCHATVFAGDANAGVSCESCHGAASGYLKVHQEKGDAGYQAALRVGMTPLVGNMERWAQQCTSCHVMDDARLIAAGHPAGDDFDLGKKYAPVAIHFKKQYDGSRLTAIGRSQIQALTRRRGGGTEAAAPPPAPPAPVPAPAPPAVVAAPPAVVTPPPPMAPVRVPPPPAPAPRATSTAPAAAPTSAARIAPPVAAPAPVPAPDPPVVTPTPTAAPPPPAYSATAAAAPAVSLSDSIGYVQGRIVSALTQLLQSGTAAPVRLSTASKPLPPYSGPDAALLQIQREAIALALEALGTAPRPSSAPVPK